MKRILVAMFVIALIIPTFSILVKVHAADYPHDPRGEIIDVHIVWPTCYQGETQEITVGFSNPTTTTYHYLVALNIIDSNGNTIYDSHTVSEDKDGYVGPGQTAWFGSWWFTLPRNAPTGTYHVLAGLRLYPWDPELDYMGLSWCEPEKTFLVKPSAEYFTHGLRTGTADYDSDGYPDSVWIEVEAGTNALEELDVDAYGNLTDPSGNVVDTDGPGLWTIPAGGASWSYRFYLYVNGGPVGMYSVDLYLYDGSHHNHYPNSPPEDIWMSAHSYGPLYPEGYGSLDGEITSYQVLTPTVVAGSQLQVQTTVKNIGNVRAEYNVWIGNIWDSGGGNVGNAYSESHQIIQLNPGVSQTLTLVWTTPPSMLVGTYYGDLALEMAYPGGGWIKRKDYSKVISFSVTQPVQHVLAVSSAHNSPNPPNTPPYHYYDDQAWVTCSVTSPVTEDGTQWTCTGWTGTGSVPPIGNDISVTFQITQDSSITWNWIAPPQRAITLKSRTTDGLENVNNMLGETYNTIIFDSVPYSVPKPISKGDGTYTVQANPPGSYSFHHWEYSGGVSVDPASKYSNPTYATVSGNGELIAVFFLDIRLCFSEGENYYPLKGLDFDQDGSIHRNAHIVDSDPQSYRLQDIDLDGGNVNGIALDAPADLYQKEFGTYRIVEYWLYYAKDDKTTFGFYNGHEHDLESIYVWIDNFHIIQKVSVNQHLWRNNYDTSLSIFGSPPKTLWVAVEKSGHGMMLVTPLSHTLLKPDNSFTVPDTPVFPFSWLFEPDAIAVLYPWRTYDGTNPTDDGFGNDALLRTGVNYDLVGCPTNWFKVGNEIVSMFGVYTFHDIGAAASAAWQNTVLLDFLADMSESTSNPILLSSDQPWVFPLKVGSGIDAYLAAPWHRRDFWNPEEPFERKGFSYLISKWTMKGVAIVIAVFAPLPINRILPTPINLVADFLFDPVNATITDSGGNVVGLKNGIWVNEIPGVLTLWHGMDWDIVLTLQGDELLECKVLTQEETTYVLSFDAIYSDNSTASFNATDIPLQSNSVHTYQMNWDLLRAGQDGTTISVDQDGDGTFDQVWHTGTTLVADQLLRAQNLNTGQGYATIQDAIDAPETLSGHVILVNEGTYYEHLVIYKSISIIGSDAGATIIDGNSTGSCFRVFASNVHIEGFCIVNGGSSFPNAGIEIYGGNVSIVHNSIAHCGLYGVFAYNLGGITIQGNNITDTASAGIYFMDMNANNTITENWIVNSNRGIVLDNSNHNAITKNKIANNSDVGIFVGGADNAIYHNDFIGNHEHVRIPAHQTNTWDDGYPSGGNYWSDYLGSDANGDGIGDTPYVIDTNNTDYYPLTNPWSSGWKLDFTVPTRHPIVDFAIYNGSLYAAADNKLFVKNISSWNIIDAPTFVVSLEPFGDKLIIGGQGGLYCYDGTSFILIFPVPTYIKVLGVYDNGLYAGTILDNRPKLYYCNGSPDNPSDWHLDTGFSAVLSFSDAFGSIDSFAVYNSAMFVSSGGTLYSFNGTDWSVVACYDDVYAYLDMKVYDGRLYLATRDQGWRRPMYQVGTGFSGRVIEFDGQNWTTILDNDYWIYSLEAYDNKLYAGTANKIYTYNGTTWETSFNAVDGAYYAISFTTYDGEIYVGMGNGYIFADPASEPLPFQSSHPLSFACAPLFELFAIDVFSVTQNSQRQDTVLYPFISSFSQAFSPANC